MSKYDECLKKLLFEAEQKGYLTFDSIMDTTDTFGLSLSEVDRVSETIHLQGIIVYEVELSEQVEDELEDYSRIDYELIFKEIVEISQELEYIVSFVKEISPPQYKEISLLTSQNANGNEYARERLILLHLRVVLKIALSMTKQYDLDITEAVSGGFTGLIVAVDKYDPNGFNAFQSYASLWIQQHIQRECTPKWVEFYFSVHYKNDLIAVKKKYEEIYGSVDFGMYEEEMVSFSKNISSSLGMESEYILQCLYRIRNQKHHHLYLDEMVCLEEINELLCHIEDKKIISPNEYANNQSLKKEVNAVLQNLTEREEKVLCLRFGFHGGREYTLEEIGKEFNVTRERIRQIEAKAIRKLRNPVRCKYLKDFF